MKIWEVKSDLNGFETLQLVNFEEDYQKYFETKFNQTDSLINIWKDVYVETIEDGLKVTVPIFGVELV
ncbi:hypothetical protein O0555_08295 [Brevibacillus laterosporus]|uniref:hypothetical protein n=1 Tax=Brevibacillus laterosporus TaxID=1465 RepID=UPI001A7EBA1F|nr:hypothetical protein [Brevibacillus laterosporus]MCR8937350.1 hypothetical protein [Brevibacillus laterosporus]MCZ0839989.1 hypothetical protein [Brevibacillus laterosporus]MCZ0843441.1 hypothetical protein [Brevibacillus laterosporus]MED1910091.1 hypothetical protein [Brevibacillus laterosporus]